MANVNCSPKRRRRQLRAKHDCSMIRSKTRKEQGQSKGYMILEPKRNTLVPDGPESFFGFFLYVGQKSLFSRSS
ncbi:hypothetical protein COLO4_23820 [Corchorus olitorius]|uniref:Uncharacterized protein n=1 Tax=Corchorus olitorius TaxID=93759 RepID=A0A1R3IEH2_9ROSI|nr:hypothetical protein COLO4_23820 [Corchorus olitorius]